jgi:hypothetical protein
VYEDDFTFLSSFNYSVAANFHDTAQIVTPPFQQRGKVINATSIVAPKNVLPDSKGEGYRNTHTKTARI